MASGVVVLGMHRSGTSAVSRVLNLLGADVGPQEDLLTEYDNPSGHWESRSLVESNDKILAAFGRSWDFPPWLAEGWERSPRATALIPELAETFSRVHGANPWVWKDPRTCLTFPLWRRVLGTDFVVVMVLREPGDVVASLRRREGIPRFYAVGLWQHYLHRAVRAAAGLPVVCLHFEDLVGSPLQVTAKLAEDLRSLGVDLSGDVTEAATSVHDTPANLRRPGPTVLRLTSSTAALLASLPALSTVFSPPSWREPRWVRPALTAYRAHWVLRARTGLPLHPRFA